MMEARKFRVSLGSKDSEHLKNIAQKLGTTESEVIRKGLQLMSLYAKTIDSDDTKLTLRQGDKSQDLLVL